jgi:aerotaxis receptor
VSVALLSMEHERPYGVDEVFYSTTDRRGVIETVNSTFVRLSRFSEDALVGAPHNLIRHPDRPGGAFRIMWDRLLAGRSMAAYVVNLAADGVPYRTFSTVTPLGDGFLSVRSAVTRPDLWEPVVDAYRLTRALENGVRRAGASRAEAATIGAQDLLRRLRGLGFDDYDDVIRTLLPAEVDGRRAAGGGSARPLTRPGDRWHDVVVGLITIDHELGELRARYEDAAEVAAELGRVAGTLHVSLDALARAADAAAEASEAVAASAPVLPPTARATVTLARALRETVRPLSVALDAQRRRLLDLRAALALSVLHTDMALLVAADLIAGTAIGDPARSIGDLTTAVASSIEEAEETRRAAAAGLLAAADAVDDAHARLLEFQRLLANWRTLVVRSGVGERLSVGLAPIDARLGEGMRDMAALTALAARCRGLAAPVDTGDLRGAAASVVGAVRARRE